MWTTTFRRFVMASHPCWLLLQSSASIRHRPSQSTQSVDIMGRPVEPNALVVLWLDRCARSLIEPKVQVLIVNHAADEATVLPHRSVHGKTETLHPEAQTLLEIRAWDDRHTRHHVHRRLLSAFHVRLRRAHYGGGVSDKGGDQVGHRVRGIGKARRRGHVPSTRQ